MEINRFIVVMVVVVLVAVIIVVVVVVVAVLLYALQYGKLEISYSFSTLPSRLFLGTNFIRNNVTS